MKKNPRNPNIRFEPESRFDVTPTTQSSPTRKSRYSPPPAESRLDSHSAYHLYLREVGQIPLLTPEEELQLAARVQQGDDEAREQMIKGNLRLVVKIARDYEYCGMPLLDLINEGNMGLMKAVERFDPTRGAKLSTYGSWWIKQSIKRAIANQSRDVRLPVHVQEKLLKIRLASSQLQESLGYEPSASEVALKTGLSVRKVACFMDASRRPASLNAPVNDAEDGTCELGQVIPDTNSLSPYERLDEEMRLSLLHEFIRELPPRELAILRHRFGLEGDVEETLESMGRKLCLTREAVRQIQNRALAKLRKKFQHVNVVTNAI